MKTIEQLEQEAKQAREEVISQLTETLDLSEKTAKQMADKLIIASSAMVTYQFALGMENADQIWNESGTKVISEKLPEASQDQKEIDADGFIKWDGGKCPVKETEMVEVKFRSVTIRNYIVGAGIFRWNHAHKSGVVDGDPQTDIVAYKIVKGE